MHGSRTSRYPPGETAQLFGQWVMTTVRIDLLAGGKEWRPRWVSGLVIYRQGRSVVSIFKHTLQELFQKSSTDMPAGHKS